MWFSNAICACTGTSIGAEKKGPEGQKTVKMKFLPTTAEDAAWFCKQGARHYRVKVYRKVPEKTQLR